MTSTASPEGGRRSLAPSEAELSCAHRILVRRSEHSPRSETAESSHPRCSSLPSDDGFAPPPALKWTRRARTLSTCCEGPCEGPSWLCVCKSNKHLEKRKFNRNYEFFYVENCLYSYKNSQQVIDFIILLFM